MQVSHVGLRVRDIEESQRFFEALGFTEATRLTLPDKIAAQLLPLKPPIGFEAVYMRHGGFTLQLLSFAGHPAPDEPERTMVGAGLTHISFAVNDMAATLAAVGAAGGRVLGDPHDGFACMCRTPEGQLIELIASKTRPVPSAK